MTILYDLKTFLVKENIIEPNKIAFNFDEYKFGDDKLILICKGGEFSNIAQKTTVSVVSKNQSMSLAEALINKVFRAFFPSGQHQKPILINNKIMLLSPLQPPFYLEKETNGRHVFSFDLKIVQKK